MADTAPEDPLTKYIHTGMGGEEGDTMLHTLTHLPTWVWGTVCTYPLPTMHVHAHAHTPHAYHTHSYNSYTHTMQVGECCVVDDHLHTRVEEFHVAILALEQIGEISIPFI